MSVPKNAKRDFFLNYIADYTVTSNQLSSKVKNCKRVSHFKQFEKTKQKQPMIMFILIV